MKNVIMFVVLATLCLSSLASAQPSPDPETATVSWITKSIEKGLEKPAPRKLALALPTGSSASGLSEIIVVTARSLARDATTGGVSEAMAEIARADIGSLLSYAGRSFSAFGGVVAIPAETSVRIWKGVSRYAVNCAHEKHAVGDRATAWLWMGVADMADASAAASQFAATTGRTVISVAGDVTSGVGEAARIVGAVLGL